MPLSVSKRSECVLQSEIRNMSIECDKVHGLNLSQGICDMKVPLQVAKSADEGIRKGFNTYTRYDGIERLRNAISNQLKTFRGINADPNSEIIVSAGSTGAFYCACLALLDQGDEIILFQPYYGYHLSTIKAAGCKAKYVTLEPPDWTFSESDFKKIITKKTKGIMINTPANPSGKVFSRKEIELICDLAKKHDMFVFTDEIYEHFVYDGHKHVSPVSINGMKERTITISGYSKTFSITGWRIGYAYCDSKWAKMLGYFNDLIYVCAPAPLQYAVARGIESLTKKYYLDLCGKYKAKRDKICDSLNDAGLRPFIPNGSYYVLADVSKIPGKSSKEKSMRLLKDTGVASVPGEAFYNGNDGENIARFCYAKEDSILDEACSRLRKINK